MVPRTSSSSNSGMSTRDRLMVESEKLVIPALLRARSKRRPHSFNPCASMSSRASAATAGMSMLRV